MPGEVLLPDTVPLCLKLLKAGINWAFSFSIKKRESQLKLGVKTDALEEGFFILDELSF
jgi:hypothetical protein